MTRFLLLSGVALIAMAAAACERTPLMPSAVVSSSEASAAAKPPASVPALAAFRCPGDCATGDAIRGDGNGSYSAVLNSNSEFNLTPSVGRVVWLDFGPVTGCTGCRRDFTTVAMNNGELQTNVIDPATGAVASNGLKSIPVGATWPAFLKVVFNTVQSGVTVQWTVRFNPRDYPQTTTIDVTRTSATSWVIEATPSDAAALLSKELRKRGETNEGVYVMPFQITVTTN